MLPVGRTHASDSNFSNFIFRLDRYSLCCYSLVLAMMFTVLLCSTSVFLDGVSARSNPSSGLLQPVSIIKPGSVRQRSVSVLFDFFPYFGSSGSN